MVDGRFEPELWEYLSAGQALRVLVIDDWGVVRAAIRKRLESRNLEVIEARNGAEALKTIQEQVPDLVLLDMVMPRLDGSFVLKALRNTFSKTQLPIISLISSDSSNEIVKALDSGANDYVTKPIDYDVLWARLSNQLVQKQAAEYLRHAQSSLEQLIRQRTEELNSSNRKLKRVIQERLLTEDRLQRQANYDELTGLPNRSLVKDRLEQTIAKAKRQGLHPGVGFLDLDNFKYVNDTLGHAAGDELLIQVATRLSACARKSDTVARLGGDEFLLILEDSDSGPVRSGELGLRHVGERIIRSFSEPFVIEGNQVVVTPSLGFAIFPRDGHDGNELMRSADAAMYRAKTEGKNSYCFYSADMTVQAKTRMQVESRLRHAIEREELSLRYQPIVDLRSGEIVRVEAVLNWDNAEVGMTAPDQLFRLAEETGLIVPIGRWVIRSVCAQLKSWRDSGICDPNVAVKLSARQFQSDARLVETVQSALNSNGLSAAAIQFELAEDMLLQASSATAEALRELDLMGIRILVDDFGTGGASLLCLQNYPVSAVKIDPRRINGISDNPRDAKLVRAIIAMAMVLDLPVVATGVQMDTQLESLRDAGCRYAQGAYFSKPLPGGRIETMLRQRRCGPSWKQALKLTTTPSIGYGA